MCDMWSGVSRSLTFQQLGKKTCARRPLGQLYGGRLLISAVFVPGQAKEDLEGSPASMRKPGGKPVNFPEAHWQGVVGSILSSHHWCQWGRRRRGQG